jgi:outer membrane protein assembly factor BamB
MSSDADNLPESRHTDPVPGGRPPVGRLLAWFVLLAAATWAYWQSDALQGNKNAAIVLALVAATGGTSIWTLRHTRGPWSRRWLRALAVWTPALAVTPLGPIKLVLNGNVGVAGWRWRWASSPDELLARARSTTDAIEWQATERDYPAFLGGRHWAEVQGVALDPDWALHPPRQLWKQPIGAGWSSFAIVGDYAITQEQRGPLELVSCYELRTGQVAWSHADEVRWDPRGNGALGKIGPRATPTVHDGRVYSHGATGILNCIDAATGELVWSHDTLAEEEAENVMWGKAGSPIVVDRWIVVSVGGLRDNSLVAYDLNTGKRAWSGGSRASSYATPVLAELAGMQQILVVNENYLTSHDATNGSVLWEHDWPGNSGSNASASQPMPIGGDRVLLTKGYGVDAEMIEVSQDAGHWGANRVWKKPVLRTKFSNVVLRDGFAYGISDVDLECVNLATGARKWKSRRRPAVENGQILLVGDYIIAQCESGETILVEATSKGYREAASFQAVEGITWNNPALSGNVLLVRNDEEAAAFELPLREDGGSDRRTAADSH